MHNDYLGVSPDACKGAMHRTLTSIWTKRSASAP